jgi:uncharacterized protein (TIGR03086 family)
MTGAIEDDTTGALELLERAVAQASAVLACVRPEQADLPTPCPAWRVGQLIDHLVHDLRQFALKAEGGKTDFSSAPKTDDWIGSFRAGQLALIDAWRGVGDLRGTVDIPGMGTVPKRFTVDQATAEFAVHTWDLARATGQNPVLDPEIAEASLTWARGALLPQYRSEAPDATFGPEVPIADDAPVYDRLAAFFGRRPNEEQSGRRPNDNRSG